MVCALIEVARGRSSRQGGRREKSGKKENSTQFEKQSVHE